MGENGHLNGYCVRISKKPTKKCFREVMSFKSHVDPLMAYREREHRRARVRDPSSGELALRPDSDRYGTIPTKARKGDCLFKVGGENSLPPGTNQVTSFGVKKDKKNAKAKARNWKVKGKMERKRE
jgi:hypothetical protein